jgi:hypothetical protein
MQINLIQKWKELLSGITEFSWVLFSNGTCVVIPNNLPSVKLHDEAIKVLKQYGPVYIGSPAGDFGVVSVFDGGWLVSGHHPKRIGITTYVDPVEVEGLLRIADSSVPDWIVKCEEDVVVGRYGRAKRDKDSKELNIIHIEDAR